MPKSWRTRGRGSEWAAPRGRGLTATGRGRLTGAGRTLAAGAMAADGDWQDFYEFQEPAGSVRDPENCNASPEAGAGAHAGGDSFPALASSLEEKLSLCFRPTSDAEPPRAAVRPITERSLLQGDE